MVKYITFTIKILLMMLSGPKCKNLNFYREIFVLFLNQLVQFYLKDTLSHTIVLLPSTYWPQGNSESGLLYI